MIIIIRNIFAYFLLSVSLIFLIKTIPSAIHEFLSFININNKVGMDITNCQTIFNSVLKVDFEYGLFKVACVGLITSLLLLLRQRTYALSLLPKNYNIAFSAGFVIFLFINLCNLYAIYDFLTFNAGGINVFERHVIYSIVFALAIFGVILFGVIYLLIWFDISLHKNYKSLILLLIIIFAYVLSSEIASFNFAWGFVSDPTNYFMAFDNILSNLGFAIFCMEDGSPCKVYLRDMQRDCESYKEMVKFPKIPGGPPLN